MAKAGLFRPCQKRSVRVGEDSLRLVPSSSPAPLHMPFSLSIVYPAWGELFIVVVVAVVVVVVLVVVAVVVAVGAVVEVEVVVVVDVFDLVVAMVVVVVVVGHALVANWSRRGCVTRTPSSLGFKDAE